MICPQCRHQIVAQARFCPECGQAQPSDSAALSANLSESIALPASAPAQNLTVAPGKAVQNAPANETLHALLTKANLCRLRKEWAEAIEHCISVLQVAPANQAAHSLLGDIYRDQGKVEEAIHWYRLAVDLRPNPFDESKLARMEQEQNRQALVRRSRSATGPIALSADGQVLVGTTNLMGVSPRRWLHGLTLISVGFLSLTIGGLLILQFRNRTRSDVPRPASGTIALPSINSVGNPMAARTGTAAGTRSSGSSPFPAASPRGTGVPPPSIAQNRPPAPHSEKELPSAPILTSPENGIPMFDPTRPLAVSPALPGVAPSPETTPTPNTGNWIPLADGLQLVSHEPGRNGENAQGTVRAPMGTLERNDARALLLRGIYRAARSVFAADSAATRATIQILAPTPNGGTIALLRAAIDRSVAYGTNERDFSAEQLETKLISLRWGANDAGAVGNPNNGDGNE